MFNLSVVGNSRVNGHAPGLASKQDLQADQRKPKHRGKPAIFHALNGSFLSSNGSVDSSNGQLKFSERYKAPLNHDDDLVNVQHTAILKDLEDPYTFSEPEPVQQYNISSSNVKARGKMSAKSVVKGKVDRLGSNNTAEPTGLNMTRLYPAISASLGHSFFSPSSPQSSTSPSNHNDLSNATLASLLESSVPDEHMPKSSELERTFASFSAKEMKCFPNLTSPPPREPDQSPPTIVTSKVSPVKHGMPSTPQRESNKLAALFSPTYPKSTPKPKQNKTPRTREKTTPRPPPCDKKVNSQKETVPKPSPSFAPEAIVKKDDVQKSTMSRLQDKIARNKATAKQNRKGESKGASEMPPRRHSVNDVPTHRERSLLEEQLLLFKPVKAVKKEELSSSGLSAAPAAPPPLAALAAPAAPAATTRVPGVVGPLTYGITRSTPSSPRSNGNSARQPKSQTANKGQKSLKGQTQVTKQSTTTYGPASSYNGRSNSHMRLTVNGTVSSTTRPHSKSEARPSKRPRIKLETSTDTVKSEVFQRLQSSKDTKGAKGDFYRRTTVHESDSDNSDLDEGLVYQKHWFSGWREAGSGLAGEERREGRLSQLRAELRRKLKQVLGVKRDPAASSLPKCMVNAALTKPSQTAVLLAPNQRWHRTGRSKLALLVQKQCVFGKKGEGDRCQAPALPCAHHCVRHIMYNVEQQLFEYCTAKFSDNTQCCVPVFDSAHELPLCTEHARKLDNYNKMCQETKPKRVRKKAKPSAMTRSSKRSKKKKQKPNQGQRSPILHAESFPVLQTTHTITQPVIQAQARIQRSQSLPIDSVSGRDPEDCFGLDSNLGGETSSSPGNAEIYVTDDTFVTMHEPLHEPMPEPCVQQINGQVDCIVDVSDVGVGVDVVEEEVLAMAADLPLDTADLAQQASGLLEEHDLTNVLNQIPPDAFNDLFIEDKTGEPTREETEELERALAAVDKDVKSLERMGSQILLDYKAQDLLQATQIQTQSQVYQSHGHLDIDNLQAQGLFDEKNTHGLLDNFLDDQSLVHSLTTQLPADLQSTGSSSGLVYYHNGYTVTGSGMDKNLGVSLSSGTTSLYQTPGITVPIIPAQTDLH